MIAARPRNMIAETSPVAPAAFTPSEAPRITMAVLMNHSGRAASLSACRQARQEISDREPREQGHDEARLARQSQRPRDPHRRTLVGRLCDIGVVAREPAEDADPRRRRRMPGRISAVRAPRK